VLEQKELAPLGQALDRYLNSVGNRNDRNILVFEGGEGELKKMMSDFGFGVVRKHDRIPRELIKQLRQHYYAVFRERNWSLDQFPDPIQIWDDFSIFQGHIQSRPDGQRRTDEDLASMEVAEFIDKVQEWLAEKRRKVSPKGVPTPGGKNQRPGR